MVPIFRPSGERQRSTELVEARATASGRSGAGETSIPEWVPVGVKPGSELSLIPKKRGKLASSAREENRRKLSSLPSNTKNRKLALFLLPKAQAAKRLGWVIIRSDYWFGSSVAKSGSFGGVGDTRRCGLGSRGGARRWPIRFCAPAGQTLCHATLAAQPGLYHELQSLLDRRV